MASATGGNLSHESPPGDVFVQRTAEQVILTVHSEGSSGNPRPVVPSLLHQLLAEAREQELHEVLGQNMHPIKAVAEERVIEVLRSLDFAPILIMPEADGRYA